MMATDKVLRVLAVSIALAVFVVVSF